jgi:hypothetical protein
MANIGFPANAIARYFPHLALQPILLPREKDADGFYIKTIQPGTVLYKGLRAGANVTCRSLADATMFYLTENPAIAYHYSNNYLCKFTCKKPLRLFVLNRENVNRLIADTTIFTEEEKKNIAFATGAGYTRAQQMNYLRAKMTPNQFRTFQQTNFYKRFEQGVFAAPGNKGARASLYDTNKAAFGTMCSKFFTPKGYDGYYAYQKHTPYHRNATGILGEFHSEMMICNGAQKIIRLSESAITKNTQRRKIAGPNNPLYSTPLATNKDIEDAIPELFLLYARNNKIPYDCVGRRITYITGGMAVRIMSNSMNNSNLSKKMVDTTRDFDFTISTSRKYTPAYLQSAIKQTRGFFDPYITNFVNGVNALYPKVSKLTLEIKNNRVFTEPKLQNAITGRLLYTVISYNIKSGTKTIDLADLAICYVPEIDDTWVDKTNTTKYGIPLLKHRYLLRDIGILLAKSFISKNKFNTKRNPVTGAAKNKGIKDMHRLSVLCGLKYNSPCARMKRLVNNIASAKNKEILKTNAVQLINELKNY